MRIVQNFEVNGFVCTVLNDFYIILSGLHSCHKWLLLDCTKLHTIFHAAHTWYAFIIVRNYFIVYKVNTNPDRQPLNLIKNPIPFRTKNRQPTAYQENHLSSKIFTDEIHSKNDWMSHKSIQKHFGRYNCDFTSIFEIGRRFCESTRRHVPDKGDSFAVQFRMGTYWTTVVEQRTLWSIGSSQMVWKVRCCSYCLVMFEFDELEASIRPNCGFCLCSFEGGCN